MNVRGIFRMHGSEHPLTVAVPISVDRGKVEADTHFLVPYEAWGLKNPSTLLLRVSNQVQINIAANGVITQRQASLGR